MLSEHLAVTMQSEISKRDNTGTKSIKKSLKIPKGQSDPYIEEQTSQWLKENIQKDKQRSTKHTYKTKDRATRTPLKSRVNLGTPEG